MPISEEERERLNHEAYMDILDLNPPRYPNDQYYMSCYTFWYSCDPTRFDRF